MMTMPSMTMPSKQMPSAHLRASLVRVVLVAALTVFVILSAGGDQAEAASCASMRAELARLSSGGSAKGQIAALERRATANGCRGSNNWGRPRVCAGIDAQISALKRGGGASNPARARQLQRAIARSCTTSNTQRQARTAPSRSRPATTSSQTATRQASFDRSRTTNRGSVIIHGTREDNFLGAEAKSESGGGFFESLFGRQRTTTRFREDGSRVNQTNERAAAPTSSSENRSKSSDGTEQSGSKSAIVGVYGGSGAKTWCVRLCDGFYFPISYSTNSSNYRRDLQICQGRCPGADVSLYSHPGYLDPEDMVSTVSGERYTALPTAFLYRTKVVPNCGCELKAPEVRTAKTDGETTTVEAGKDGAANQDAEPSQTAEVADEIDIEEPVALAAYSEEPSTASPADAVIDLNHRPSDEEMNASPPRPITEADLNVRKVGPRYFADRISASADEAPDQTTAQ